MLPLTATAAALVLFGAAILSGACTSQGGHPAVVDSHDVRGRLPIFEVYERNDVLKRTEDTIVLNLRIDLHGADCGAPDGYGHDMVIVLAVARASGQRHALLLLRDNPYSPPSDTDDAHVGS